MLAGLELVESGLVELEMAESVMADEEALESAQ